MSGKNEIIILTDTREKGNTNILKKFDKMGIQHIKTTLTSADYMAIKHDIERGIYLDYSTLIDKKDGLLELSGNLCRTSEHERVKREIQRAKELGCEDFIFLVQDDKIKSADDIKKWTSPHTKVKGETLFKILSTFKERYKVRFIFTPKKEMAQKIFELLKK